MALLRLRRSGRAIAALLLIASLRALPHLESDDLGCLPVADEQEQASASLRPQGTESSSEHCDVCHLTRSIRAPRPSAALVVTPAVRVQAIWADWSVRPRAADLHVPSGRAPPASL
jgi:hypothetical protein